MAGSADGYRRIPKRLRVLYCFQFASVSVHSEHILSWALSLRFTRVVMDLWRGGKRTFISQTEGSNVARFSSLSIVPLLTATKALEVGRGRGGDEREGLPSAGRNKTFIRAVFYSFMLGAALKVKFWIYISRPVRWVGAWPRTFFLMKYCTFIFYWMVTALVD